MKLRIKGSSVRLRLTQGELNALASTGAIEDRVPFGGTSELVYRLVRDSGNSEIAATYRNDLIEVRVPAAALERWHGTDLITLVHSQPVPGGELRITLEKDFACLAPRAGEDESDNFPHPQGTEGATCA